MTKWDVIQRELQEIWDHRGKLDAADVVKVAKSPKHPLHKYFTWDDTEAARLRRLDEARFLIRHVNIEVETIHGGRPNRVRAFVAVNRPSTGYAPTKDVGANKELSTLVLRQMKRDIENLVRKYEHLAEFWGLVDELLMPKRKRKIG